MYGISFKPLWIPSFSGIINRMELLTGTVPVNNFLLTGTVPVNNSLLTGTHLNVRRCWLYMPLGAGVLRWVLACHTIENKNKRL